MYQLFTRSWWRKNPRTKQLEPHKGRKTVVDYTNTIEEARERCSVYNSSLTKAQQNVGHKMEFTSDY